MFVLDELADALIANGEDVLKLTIGISELEPPKEVLEKFSEASFDLPTMRKVFPEGMPELRQAIADYYNAAFKANVSEEQVLVSTGTSSIFRNLIYLTTRPGQSVLMPRPFYSLYKMSVILNDAKVTFYDVNPEDGKIDLKSFRANYNRDETSCVVINSPGNPLGNFVSQEEVKGIYEIVDASSYVICDEIYNNVCFYDEFVCPLAYLSDRDRDVTIVTNGFSKGFRMYTKRIGFCILPPELIMPMRIIQQHTLLTSDPSSQLGMIEALKNKEAPRELTDLYRERAEYTFKQLQDTDCVPIRSEGGFYITLDCSKRIDWHDSFTDSKDLARDILHSVRVSVVPGTDFGIPKAIRLSFCNDRYTEAVNRLKAYFSSHV